MKIQTVQHMKHAGRESVSVCATQTLVVSMPSARVSTTNSNAIVLMALLVTHISTATEVSTPVFFVYYIPLILM